MLSELRGFKGLGKLAFGEAAAGLNPIDGKPDVLFGDLQVDRQNVLDRTAAEKAAGA